MSLRGPLKGATRMHCPVAALSNRFGEPEPGERRSRECSAPKACRCRAGAVGVHDGLDNCRVPCGGPIYVRRAEIGRLPRARTDRLRMRRAGGWLAHVLGSTSGTEAWVCGTYRAAHQEQSREDE